MKIRIELDDSLQEQEIIIRAPELTPEISQLQKLIGDATKATKSLEFYKGDTRVYISLDEVLFFETDEKGISAHTRTDSYEIRYKLYELEERLAPHRFVRISNSEIVNARMITGMDFSLTGTIRLSLRGGVETYASRRYVSKIRKLFDV